MCNHLNLGWNEFFQNQIDNNTELKFFRPARVIIENKNRYLVLNELGEFEAEISGKLMFTTDNPAQLPKVGDWVLIDIYDEGKAIIHKVLDRKTVFSRKTSGLKFSEQVIVSNIDYLFIVQSCNDNFNLRRLERYLFMADAGGITPVMILSKTDLVDNIDDYNSQISKIYPQLAIFALSNVNKTGITQLNDFLIPNKTYAFVGSSGTGKSTLINNLIGYDLQKTNEIREKDDRGKHTTTKRELIILPNNALLIDTPGMREFHLWKTDTSVEDMFSEIEELEQNCKYSDCKHINEKGCAIIAAVNEGLISKERYNSFLKLKKEEEYIELKDDKTFLLQRKDKLKKRSKLIKETFKHGDKYKN